MASPAEIKAARQPLQQPGRSLMRITLLGTGCPAVHPRRYGASQLVEGGGARLLVDCGNGCSQRLVQAGHSPAAPDALLVTHLHSDHLVDLWQLTVAGWHAGRPEPLRLYGPAPVLQHAATLRQAWAAERAQRIAYEQRPNGPALDLELVEITAGETLNFGALSVQVVAVDHRPVVPAFGFVFEADGRKLVLSGDTAPTPALVAAAEGCDLLVHEVFAHDAFAPLDGVRSAATVEAVTRYHTLSTDVGRIAADAGAKALLLTHIVPPTADPATLLADVRAAYAGPTIVGEDLMAVDLATGSVHWQGMVAAFAGMGAA
jgi:ribonuclease Z